MVTFIYNKIVDYASHLMECQWNKGHCEEGFF